MAGYFGSAAGIQSKARTQRKRSSGLNEKEITLLFMEDGTSPSGMRRSKLIGFKGGANIQKMVRKGLIKENKFGYYDVTPRGKQLRKTLV